MKRRDPDGTILLQGILTAGEWDDASGQRTFILWTYDEQEHLILFNPPTPPSDLSARLPTKVEIKGVPVRDHKGRKAVTARKCKLIHAEETK